MTESYGVEQFAEDMRAITSETSDDGEIVARVKPLAIRFAKDKS
jgi:hypothetical protein